MGLLVDGKWTDRWYDTSKSGGRFIRSDAQFRDAVTSDGSSAYPAEPGRYHLYVSHACPWAHRTLIYRKQKKLEDVIDVSVVHWFMGEQGWTFESDPDSTQDAVNGATYMYQVYQAADPTYSGRVTVPVLWDKKTGSIVNNESSEIIRMFNGAFDAWGEASLDFYPAAVRADIDALNDVIYNHVNNGVYKCGFATSQEAYEEAYNALFDTLDMIETRLGKHRYLTGERVTEADWRLFPTLVRFEVVYNTHFKCNKQRLRDYPNLWNYTLDLYQKPGIAETVNFRHIKQHYFGSHESINPHRIVPLGPAVDFDAPHDRGRFGPDQ